MNGGRAGAGEAFVLLDTVHFMPFELFSEEELGRVGRFRHL